MGSENFPTLCNHFKTSFLTLLSSLHLPHPYFLRKSHCIFCSTEKKQPGKAASNSSSPNLKLTFIYQPHSLSLSLCSFYNGIPGIGKASICILLIPPASQWTLSWSSAFKLKSESQRLLSGLLKTWFLGPTARASQWNRSNGICIYLCVCEYTDIMINKLAHVEYGGWEFHDLQLASWGPRRPVWQLLVQMPQAWDTGRASFILSLKWLKLMSQYEGN